MNKLLAISAASLLAVAVAVPALADDGSHNPLGLQASCTAKAYSYGDYINQCTFTTSRQSVYDVAMLNPGFPGGGYYVPMTNSSNPFTSIAPHSTVSTAPYFGAWYVDGHTTLELPTTYQDKQGWTYAIQVPVTYTIEP